MSDEAKALHLVLPDEPASDPQPAGSRSLSSALLERPSEGDHVVQFYEDDALLVEAVAHQVLLPRRWVHHSSPTPERLRVDEKPSSAPKPLAGRPRVGVP
jgi:hypothetical protein